MATSLYKAQEAMRICDDHEHEELSCFCKTCKKFICTRCAKTEHHGHDWDIVSLIAKKRRKETPELCRKIKTENMPPCREKLRVIDDNISAMEKKSDEDVQTLEGRRTAMINVVNRIFDEIKRKREGYKKEESTKMQEQSYRLRTKIEYLDKMISSLDTNIGVYADYDVIEMELNMLTALREVESLEVDRSSSAVKFVPGKINEGEIEKMIGCIEETIMASVDDVAIVGELEEIKSFKEFSSQIDIIVPISSCQAWACDSSSSTIKLLSLQNTETKSISLPSLFDFIVLSNGEFIVTDPSDQVLQRVTSTGKVSDIISTKPLHPSFISKSQTNDIYVSLSESEYIYKLKPSSRRLVQRITLLGKVLKTYEFRDDGTTRLFTLPGATAENGNSDICVINCINDYSGEIVVLREDGRMRFTYRGQDDSAFDPTDIACDSKNRIVVSDFRGKPIHLLRADGTFLTHLLSDVSLRYHPRKIAFFENNMWTGFRDGTVKVYKYT